MLIKSAFVFDNNSGFVKRDISICGDIISPSNNDDDYIDAEGLFAIPGMTDIHFHGCAGYDLCDASVDSLKKIAEYQLKCGVTQLCPATMALPPDRLNSVMTAYRKYSQSKTERACSHYVGLNIEGCFIAPQKCGAHTAKYIQPLDIGIADDLNAACGGAIRLVTVAPERDEDGKFIAALVKRNIRVCVGHTVADYWKAREAFKRGAMQVTHLFNAMPPFMHRDTGVIGAAFDDSRVMAELICDGIHVSPPAVRAAFKLFGDDRIVLISDGMRAAGLTDGEYKLGESAVIKRDNEVRMTNGTLAGSASTLLDCVRNAVRMGIPFASVVRAACVNTAQAIGIYDKYGSIAVGKYANIILLNSELSLVGVINRGVPIFIRDM